MELLIYLLAAWPRVSVKFRFIPLFIHFLIKQFAKDTLCTKSGLGTVSKSQTRLQDAKCALSALMEVRNKPWRVRKPKEESLPVSPGMQVGAGAVGRPHRVKII